MKSALLCGLLFLTLTAPDGVSRVARFQAGRPPSQPILRIEAGGHFGSVRSPVVDPKGRFLITISDQDRTARVWSLPDLQPIRVIRPPVGVQADWSNWAAALSPDGATLAVAGDTGGEFSAYLFQVATGRMVGRLTGFPSTVLSLAYSPDGKRVAAGMFGGGVRVISVENGKELWRDYQHDTVFVTMDPHGNLAVCGPKTITLFDPTGKVKAIAKTDLSFQLAFSPDGSLLAVGRLVPGSSVVVLSGKDLTELYRPDVSGLNGDFACVDWSRDGSSLFAGRMATDASGAFFLRRWTNRGKGTHTDVRTVTGDVNNIRPMPDGRMVFTTSQGFGIIGTDGRKDVEVPGKSVEFVNSVPSLRISKDGGSIWYTNLAKSSHPLEFSLSGREVRSDVAGRAYSVGVGPLHKAPGLEPTEVDLQHNSEQPMLNGKPLDIEPGDHWFCCLTIQPDGQGFVYGSQYGIHCYDRSGKRLWDTQLPGYAHSLSITGDGRMVAVLVSGGLLYWCRMSDGKVVLSLFVHADLKRWVAWTESGYYDCSPGAEDLLGWHLNNGFDHEADFYGAGRFRDTYYRPDVVARMLHTLDEGEALRQANAATGIPSAPSIAAQIPPVVRIVSAALSGEARSPRLTVRYALRTPNGEPATHVDLYVDGRLAGTDGANVSAREEVVREVTLNLDASPSLLCLQAWNKYAPGELTRRELVASRGSVSGGGAPKPIKPRLWIVSIGVGKFNNAETDGQYHLQYAAADAESFASAMRAQSGEYADVQVRVVKDRTASEIRDDFDWLRSNMAENDVAMIFMAGHGLQDPALNYYFLASDYDPAHLSNTTVRFGELLDVIGTLRTKGKVFSFIDTCHAARSTRDIDATGLYLKFGAPEVGAITFFACSGNQSAREGDAWGGHGAFTYYLVKGLLGDGAQADGRVTANSLAAFIDSAFEGDPKLKGLQTPCMQIPVAMALNVPISRVKHR